MIDIIETQKRWGKEFCFKMAKSMKKTEQHQWHIIKDGSSNISIKAITYIKTLNPSFQKDIEPTFWKFLCHIKAVPVVKRCEYCKEIVSVKPFKTMLYSIHPVSRVCKKCSPILQSARNQDIPLSEWNGFIGKDWRKWSDVTYLNKPFWGCHRHHLTQTLIACIPKELHGHIPHVMKTDKGMAEMNMLALQFIDSGL